MTNDRFVLERKRSRSVVSGTIVAALGLLALAIAAVEYYVFTIVVVPGNAENGLFGMTAGTTVYVAGYAAAGVILFAVGVSKMRRARRST